jgi:hypothetical protein
MKHSEDRSSRRLVPLLFTTAPAGCAPTLDVAGVYFPGWLVSAVTGVFVSYLVVVWLGRLPGTRRLADSGLLFVGLVECIAIVVWWAGFSRF